MLELKNTLQDVFERKIVYLGDPNPNLKGGRLDPSPHPPSRIKDFCTTSASKADGMFSLRLYGAWAASAAANAVVPLLSFILIRGHTVAAASPADVGNNSLEQPIHVHLSLASDPSKIVVTWTTFNKTSSPQLAQFGVAPSKGAHPKFDRQVRAQTTRFVDDGPEWRTMYIHRAVLLDLSPGTPYIYRVGSDRAWSKVFWFTAQRDDSDFAPTLAVYGDLGVTNSHSMPHLIREVQERTIDAVLHVGDLAYDLDTDNARIGDAFMQQIEPIAAYVPYQTCVGNHESAYNFSNYKNRFSMMNPDGKINNFYYSFNYGSAHIVGYSTEFYFFIWYGWRQIIYQYEWLERDLIEATKPENRKKHPWIIVMGHRPMYCSNKDLDDCRFNESIVRRGIPIVHAYGLENLFYKYGVDISISAHEHSYERLWPIYDRKVYNGSTAHPYTNPKAPVHIITGSAGSQEGLDPFANDPSPWSAFRLKEYGYTRMMLHNASHLTVEQVLASNGTVADQITIVKDHHGPYKP